MTPRQWIVTLPAADGGLAPRGAQIRIADDGDSGPLVVDIRHEVDDVWLPVQLLGGNIHEVR